MIDPGEAGGTGGLWPDEALVRPAIEVYDRGAEPATRIITPPPNRFTHELIDEVRVGRSAGPTGVLAVGTHVLLMGVHGDRCWVVDGAGRHLEVGTSSLRPLPDEPKDSRP